MNAQLAIVKGPTIYGQRVWCLSESQAKITVAQAPTKYTGTVNSCASTLVYPSPRMMLKENICQQIVSDLFLGWAFDPYLGALYVKPYKGMELPQ